MKPPVVNIKPSFVPSYPIVALFVSVELPSLNRIVVLAFAVVVTRSTITLLAPSISKLTVGSVWFRPKAKPVPFRTALVAPLAPKAK